MMKLLCAVIAVIEAVLVSSQEGLHIHTEDKGSHIQASTLSFLLSTLTDLTADPDIKVQTSIPSLLTVSITCSVLDVHRNLNYDLTIISPHNETLLRLNHATNDCVSNTGRANFSFVDVACHSNVAGLSWVHLEFEPTKKTDIVGNWGCRLGQRGKTFRLEGDVHGNLKFDFKDQKYDITIKCTSLLEEEHTLALSPPVPSQGNHSEGCTCSNSREVDNRNCNLLIQNLLHSPNPYSSSCDVDEDGKSLTLQLKGVRASSASSAKLTGLWKCKAKTSSGHTISGSTVNVTDPPIQQSKVIDNSIGQTQHLSCSSIKESRDVRYIWERNNDSWTQWNRGSLTIKNLDNCSTEYYCERYHIHWGAIGPREKMLLRVRVPPMFWLIKSGTSEGSDGFSFVSVYNNGFSVICSAYSYLDYNVSDNYGVIGVVNRRTEEKFGCLYYKSVIFSWRTKNLYKRLGANGTHIICNAGGRQDETVIYVRETVDPLPNHTQELPTEVPLTTTHEVLPSEIISTLTSSKPGTLQHENYENVSPFQNQTLLLVGVIGITIILIVMIVFLLKKRKRHSMYNIAPARPAKGNSHKNDHKNRRSVRRSGVKHYENSLPSRRSLEERAPSEDSTPPQSPSRQRRRKHYENHDIPIKNHRKEKAKEVQYTSVVFANDATPGSSDRSETGALVINSRAQPTSYAQIEITADGPRLAEEQSTEEPEQGTLPTNMDQVDERDDWKDDVEEEIWGYVPSNIKSSVKF